MKKWLVSLFVGIGLALPLSLPASAGETESEGLTVLDEIVVTATKTEEKRKDVPNAVILKDAMDIKDSGATSLGDLLGNEMGIDWRDLWRLRRSAPVHPNQRHG